MADKVGRGQSLPCDNYGGEEIQPHFPLIGPHVCFPSRKSMYCLVFSRPRHLREDRVGIPGVKRGFRVRISLEPSLEVAMLNLDGLPASIQSPRPFPSSSTPQPIPAPRVSGILRSNQQRPLPSPLGWPLACWSSPSALVPRESSLSANHPEFPLSSPPPQDLDDQLSQFAQDSPSLGTESLLS